MTSGWGGPARLETARCTFPGRGEFWMQCHFHLLARYFMGHQTLRFADGEIKIPVISSRLSADSSD